MFSKANQRPMPPRSGAGTRPANDRKPATPSIISCDLTINGDLVSDGEVQVDGKVEGDVRSRSLLVGVNGNILGSINADAVRIHGSVTGHVVAKSVFLAATAHMTGDITHESLAIEPGAFLEGHCRRINDPIPAEAPRPELMITDARLKRVVGKVASLPVGTDDKKATAG